MGCTRNSPRKLPGVLVHALRVSVSPQTSVLVVVLPIFSEVYLSVCKLPIPITLSFFGMHSSNDAYMATTDLNNFKLFFSSGRNYGGFFQSPLLSQFELFFPLQHSLSATNRNVFLCYGKFSAFQCEVLNMSTLNLNFWNQSLHTS